MVKFGLSYLSKNCLKFLILIFFSIINACVQMGIPFLTASIIDSITMTSPYDLKRGCIWFAILSIFSIIFNYISTLLQVQIENTSAYHINKDVICHLQSVSTYNFPKNDVSYVTQRINIDSNTISSFCISNFKDILIQTLTLLTLCIIVARINIYIFIIFIILALIYFFTYLISKKHIYILNSRCKEEQSKFFSKMNQQLYNHTFIKTHSLKYWFISKLEIAFKNLYTEAYKLQKFLSAYFSISSIINILSQIVIFIYGGMTVINGHMTLGIFTILTNYFQMLLGTAKFFSSLGKTYQDASVSFDRLMKFYEIPSEIDGTQLIDEVSNVSLNNVSMYLNKKPIIINFSYTFSKGNIYGIIGSNGSGKSTLGNILLGLNCQEIDGTVEINGIDIRNINLYDLRRNKIAYVEQESRILNESILDNILLDKKGDDSSVKKILRMLGGLESSKNIENRLDEVIGVDSKSLSGGERQKISIAREILKQSEVFIADEPTSALDIIGTDKFIKLIKKKKAESIIILITHDNRLISSCDHVIDLS